LSSSAGLLTDLSARKTFIPRLAHSFSKPDAEETPGEKQASIPSKSSGVKYPPSPLGPNLIRFLSQLIG
jgi:hypothetical protein